MKIDRSVIAIICLMLAINVAGAWQFFQIVPQQNQNRWTSLSNELLAFNTPQNIAALNNGMNEYGARSVRVDIIDLHKSFYVVSGRGITFTSQTVDRSFKLTENQIRSIMRMLQDGHLSQFERFQLWLMLR